MPTIHELQADAILTDNELAREAGISLNTLRKIKRGMPTTPFVVGKVVRVLGEKLGQKLKTSDIDGIKFI